ncbi:hypothetical protein ECEC1865_5983, partial [Escherichia coli EC1865]
SDRSGRAASVAP